MKTKQLTGVVTIIVPRNNTTTKRNYFAITIKQHDTILIFRAAKNHNNQAKQVLQRAIITIGDRAKLVVDNDMQQESSRKHYA